MTHRSRTSDRITWLLLAVGLGACSSDASATLDPDVLRVAGTYATTVTVQQRTCTAIIVANNPTTVSHVPDAQDVTLTHAGNAYTGTVQRDGSFATIPRSVGEPADTQTLTIAGRFSTSGFEAAVTIDVSHNGSPVCNYVVRWVGTKDGAPNVIPE